MDYEMLIGQPAIEGVKWLAEQYLDAHRFVFVEYKPKLPERKGEIRIPKENDVFFNLPPERVLDGGLEEEINVAVNNDGVVGLISTVLFQSEMGPLHFKHLFLLDLDKHPTPKNIEELKQQLKKRIGVDHGFIIRSSVRGMHFLCDGIFTFEDWLKCYGRSLLMNHDGDRWVDERYVGHTFEGHPTRDNIGFYATLRLSGAYIKKEMPVIVDVL